jgi:hypothetical protein
MRPPRLDFANDDRQVRERLLDARTAAAAGMETLHHQRLADIGLGDDRLSTSRSWLFSALAIADSSVFLTSPAMRFLRELSSASAVDLLAADHLPPRG